MPGVQTVRGSLRVQTSECQGGKVTTDENRQERIQKLLLAVEHCKQNAKALGLKIGNGGAATVDCPVCMTGTIHYTVASCNGHMWGKCTTKGCVAWME